MTDGARLVRTGGVDAPLPSDPEVSVVVVHYNMAREVPRTLASLSPARQRGIAAADYEVVLVDNGSSYELSDSVLAEFGGRLITKRIDAAPLSPARAANHGLACASGAVIGLVVDGARLASPGLVGGARRAATLADRPVITAPAFHLGPTPHMRASETGYDQEAEDRLLATVDWQRDGYELFRISTPAGSAHRGLFGPMGESSSLFAWRETWNELGGLDERFVLPGGGLVNHDLYRRGAGWTASSSSSSWARAPSTNFTVELRPHAGSRGPRCTTSTNVSAVSVTDRRTTTPSTSGRCPTQPWSSSRHRPGSRSSGGHRPRHPDLSALPCAAPTRR